MKQKLSMIAGPRRACFSYSFGMTLALVGASLLGPSARAAVDFRPLATIDVSHNTNVFARPADQPPFPETGNTALGDTITQYLVGAIAEFTWMRDKLSLTAQGSRFDYNHFGELNHYDSKFGGSLDWRLGTILDGNVGYTQSRLMGPLADTLADQLEIQTEKQGTATVRLLITPRWRFDVKPVWHDLESPLPAFPQFGFKETSVTGTLNYVGIDKLTAGLRWDYLDGSFHHIVAATKYRQTTAELVANYAVTNFSTFDAEAGFTRRNNSLVNPQDAVALGLAAAPAGTNSAFTGALGFRRQFSSKTSASVRILREIDSYVAGANPAVSTSGEATVKWEPDFRFSFVALYRLGRQAIQGAVANSDFTTRSDTARHAELAVEYHALYWLTFRPYALYDKRTSSFHDANYSATIAGIQFTAQLQPLR
jgi:hypothetical protein